MRNKLVFLDGIRGLAALYVVIHHARWVLWEGYHEGYLLHPEHYGASQKVFMYLLSCFRYGHEVVILFFVLSGFVIHLRYSKALATDNMSRFDYKYYLVRRTRRIVPPMLLALLLTFVLDTIGILLKLPIYDGICKYTSIAENLRVDHNMTTLFGNLVFLMKIYVPVWGTNGPLWSLAYEWWFYMLYPLVFMLSRKNVWLPFIVIFLLGILAIMNVLPLKILNQVLALMPAWWLGAFLADVFIGRIKISFDYLLWFFLLIPLCLFGFEWLPFGINGVVAYWLWGLGFMGLFSLGFSRYGKGRLRFLEHLKPLGDISYSLYVLHMPVLVLMSAAFMSIDTERKLPEHFYFVVLGVLLSLLVGYIGYRIVEKPLIAVRS